MVLARPPGTGPQFGYSGVTIRVPASGPAYCARHTRSWTETPSRLSIARPLASSARYADRLLVLTVTTRAHWVLAANAALDIATARAAATMNDAIFLGMTGSPLQL